jgi:hypothetical protein
MSDFLDQNTYFELDNLYSLLVKMDEHDRDVLEFAK